MKSYAKSLPTAGHLREQLEVTSRQPSLTSPARGHEDGTGRIPAGKRAALESELPLLVSIDRAGKELGIGRSLVYELLGAKQLASVKIGRRRFIRRDDLVRFVRDLQAQ
jgi:excisionase family DNA binding protein